MSRLVLPRPDDWHLHVRDGAAMAAVVPHTAASFGRALLMPNTKPPVTTVDEAAAYRERVLAAVPKGADFTPYFALYLTDRTTPDDVRRAKESGFVLAFKLYPAGATTHSDAGVRHLDRLGPVLDAMEAVDLPLLVHGEVTDPEVDVFDREATFLDGVLAPIVARHPRLRVVFEHITTAEAAAYVSVADAHLLAATVTPHHLMLNRGAMFEGGIRPHMYCLPIIKRETHRQALVKAVCSGDAHYFLGTDSAPHVMHTKESDCGCAGIYNAPVALAAYAEVFAAHDALPALEAFAARNGPAFYGLPVNTRRITLTRDAHQPPPSRCVSELGDILVFDAPGTAQWRVSPAP